MPCISAFLSLYISSFDQFNNQYTIYRYKVFMDKEKNDAGEAVGFSFEKASKEYDERRAAEAAGEGDEDDEDSLYS